MIHCARKWVAQEFREREPLLTRWELGWHHKIRFVLECFLTTSRESSISRESSAPVRQETSSGKRGIWQWLRVQARGHLKGCVDWNGGISIFKSRTRPLLLYFRQQNGPSCCLIYRRSPHHPGTHLQACLAPPVCLQARAGTPPTLPLRDNVPFGDRHLLAKLKGFF